MIGGGTATFSKITGYFSLHNVSPVTVSFNLATPAISPGISASACFWFLPSKKKIWPNFSVIFLVELYTAESELSFPE